MHSNKSAIVILAAGEARRLGRAKQLLKHKGKNLLQHCIETGLATKCPVVVVLGAHLEDTMPIAEKYPVEVVVNNHFKNGISTSIVEAVKVCQRQPKIKGLLMTLVDQPKITSNHLSRILEFSSSTSNIVATEYQGTIGVPAYFPRKYFKELVRLQGDSGARQLFERYHGVLDTISFEDAALDIDTELDWKEFLEGLDQ